MSKFWLVDSFREYAFNAVFDLESDTLKLALATSAVASSYSAWAASTAYSVGDIRIPTTRNGHRYICTVAGTSAASEPTWPTVTDNTVVDGGVTWQEYGGDMLDKTIWGDISANEVASGDGYTTGGETLTSSALSRTNRDVTWDAADITISALTKTFRTGWIYKVGTVGAIVNPLIGCIMYNDDFTDKSVSAVDLVTQIATAGLVTISK